MANVVEEARYRLSVEGQAQVEALDRVVAQLGVTEDRLTVSEERLTRASRTKADSMDRLLGRLDPRVRAEQQLQAALAQINRFEEEGIGSIEQRAAAVTAATQRYADAMQRLKGTKSEGVFLGAAEGAKLSAFQMQNLTFQINDIGTMLASGQNPFVLLMQQGLQISQIFGPGVGVVGAMKSVGGAIVSFVTNPLTLAVIGIAAVAGVVSMLFSSISSDASSTEDGLKRHKDLVDEITKAWEKAAKGVQEYGARTAETLLADALTAQRDAAAAMRDEIEALGRNDSFSQIAASAGVFGAALASARNLIVAVKNQIDLMGVPQGFVDDWNRFQSDLESGTGDVVAYRQRLDELAAKFPSSEALTFRDRIVAITEALYQATLRANEAGGSFAKLGQIMAGVSVEMTRAMQFRFSDAFGGTEDLKGDLDDFLAEEKKAAEDAAKTAKSRQESIDKVIESLQFEAEQVRRTAREQEIYNALKQASVTLDSEAGQRIAELAGHLYDLREAQKRYNDLLKEAKGYAVSFTQSLVQGLMKGESVTAALASSLSNLSSQLANSAITKLFSGDFVGAAVSGIGALISGIFGGAAEEAAEREKARQAWKDMSADVAAFSLEMSGQVSGSLREALSDGAKRFQEFARAAKDAGVDIGDLQADFRDWQRGMKREFRATFDGMIKSLKSGQGLSSDYAAGVEQAKALRTALLGFVDDAITAFGKGSPQVKAAKQAARDSALDILRGSGTDDKYLSEYNRLQGAADVLRKTLRDLGMTASNAANVVNNELNLALGRLRDEFVTDLNKKINELLGSAHKNEVIDLLKEREQLLADASILGTNPAQVEQFFRLMAQRIVDQAELTGQAFQDLITQFPQLVGVVHEFSGSLEDAADRLIRAREELNRIGRTIADYIAELQGGANSTLSPQDRLTAAQTAYNSQIVLAQGGDIQAQASITEFADRLLEAARDFYASGQGFQNIFAQVQQDLIGLPAVQGSTDPSTAALIAAISATTLAVTTGTTTQVGTAVDVGGQTTAELDFISVLTQTVSNTLAAINTTMTNMNIAVGAVTTAVNAVTAALAGGDGVKERLFNIRASINGGFAFIADNHLSLIAQFLKDIRRGTGDWQTKDIRTGDPKVPKLLGFYPGFAEGGIVGNGIFDRDSVMARFAGGGNIALAGGEGIINAAATRSIGPSMIDMMNQTGRMPGNDNIAPAIAMQTSTLVRAMMAMNQALIEELRASRAELAEIRGSGQQLVTESRRSERPGKTGAPKAA